MEANEAGKKSCAGAILSKTKLRNSRKQEIDANQFMPPKPHTGPENGNLPHNGRTKQGRQKNENRVTDICNAVSVRSESDAINLNQILLI